MRKPIRTGILAAFLVLINILGFGQKGGPQLQLRQTKAQRRSVNRALTPSAQKLKAISFAKKKGLTIRKVYSNGRIIEIHSLSDSNHPLYLTTHNLNAAKTVSTNLVWSDNDLGFNLQGEGVTVGIWDGGKVFSTHPEFEGRVTPMDAASSFSNHSTHVSGTIGAAGTEADAKGMAPKVDMETYDWNNVLKEMRSAAQSGMTISNHSWGVIHGWDYDYDEKKYKWYGNTSISEEEDFYFGFYSNETSKWDEVAWDYPYFLMVMSAGNDRGERGTSTHLVNQNGKWVEITKYRKPDGGTDGYDCIGTYSTAKNILTVGAIHDIPNGYNGPNSVKMSSFSCWGPTDDGRIKPDLVGNGVELKSTRNGGGYEIMSGTSMSCPSVTGSLSLLQGFYHKHHNQYMRSATLKGLAIHSCDEAGDWEGPDYKFGWGLLNTAKGAQVIDNKNNDHHIIETTLQDQGTYSSEFLSSGQDSIVATLCWTDLMGESPAPSLDPEDLILVHDLDIRIIRQKDGHIFYPYILDPKNPDQPATTGDNFRDNIEKIVIKNPEKGAYKLVITHKNSLKGVTQQDFSLILSGLSESCKCKELQEHTENSGYFASTLCEENYYNNSNCTWLLKPENKKPIYLSFTQFRTQKDHDIVKVYEGESVENGTLLGSFSGTETPETLIAESGVMTVHFSSDASINDIGWKASYYTEPPEIIEIEGPDFPCQGNNLSYVTVVNGAVNYEWSWPEGWQATPEGNTLKIQNISGQGTIGVKVTNNLGETALLEKSIKCVTSPPLATSSIEGPTTPCFGSEITYETEAEEGAWYEWTLPENWTGESTTHQIQTTAGEISGNILVKTINACGSGPDRDLPVTTEFVPDKPYQLGYSDLTPCPFSEKVITITVLENPEEEIPDDVKYVWEVPNSWTLLTDLESNKIKFHVGGKSEPFSVAYKNRCGVGEKHKADLILAPLPIKPIISPKEEKLAISNDQIDGDTFKWYWLSDPNEDLENGLIVDKTENQIYPTRNGYYFAEVINVYSCSTISDPFEINNTNKKVIIAPNPTHLSFTIINDTGEPGIIKVYNLTGSLILQDSNVSPGTHTLTLPQKGMYILNFQNNQHSVTRKIVLQ